MKHKHAELIKAWADGAQIQVCYCNEGTWEDVDYPAWGVGNEYRIKPEEKKPDVVKYLIVHLNYTGTPTRRRYDSDNVKFTYDGETGKLKLAEVL